MKLELECGHTIYLDHLQLTHVYAGILEGLPTPEENVQIVESSIEQARSLAWTDSVHLIQPVEKPIKVEGKYPFGTPAKLPPILCISAFHSLDPVSEKSGAYSALKVVWFQEEFQVPFPDEIVAQIQKLDWNELAEDKDY
jgi:hypothetical protein